MERITDAWIEDFKHEVNYDLEDRDRQFGGYLAAALEVSLAYLGDVSPEVMESETLRQAVFVYARNLFDTGGMSDKGVPPAYYNLLNILKQ